MKDVELYEPLAARIKRLREGAGLTQDELAKKINVPEIAISYWESSVVSPIEYHNLMGLAREFNVTVSELLDEHQKYIGEMHKRQ
ncbi:helix-turn-helix domain-containing protein [Halomonas caseinilytica]|uniref:helix-turn-helix domain-containing protein n=1 Tax=Halomonas caseinilytica TaxID=438744 RepID=UPI0007E5BAF3|nr:helix-turn-helix transcriptional regulator [Halomonas caseinilytica]SEN54387.1 Helix-turn-helix [Halomonas caseinilytica]